MRRVSCVSRRRFGQGLGGSLALAALPRPAPAHDGPHEIEIGIAEFAYLPARVEVLAGDTVVWRNDDLAPHTATARDGSWDTGPIGKGARGGVRFATPGDYPYVCAYHPHMSGAVIVRARDSG